LKAVSAIKTLDKEIESEHDVENLRGVGSKIIKKVKELVQTGRLEKLEKMQTNERRVVIENFCKIWGVGPSKAEELYHNGVRSIE
jgi:DNA polymerase/3'-5' exonuclease PolX